MQLCEKEKKIQALTAQVEALEEEKKRFIESSYDGYWDWYIQDDYEYMSPRFWEMFGIDPKTKLHKPSEWQDIIFEEDLKVALENFDQHVKSRGKHPYRQEVRYRHVDGSTITVLCRGQVIAWDEEGRPLRMVGTHTDITHIKNLEVERQAHQLKTELLADVSHEFRSALNCMRLASEYLALMGSSLPPQAHENLKIIQSAGDDLESLITGILENARRGEGYLVPVMKIFSVHDLAEKIRLNFQHIADKKSINFHVTLDSRLGDFMSDATFLYQILTNLVTNALKSTPRGGEISVHFGGQFLKSIPMLVMTVKDTGQGIEKSHLDKIFERFYQGHGRQKKGPGYGLGLSICKQLVLRLGGSIDVESVIGEGSVFTVRVPCQKSPAILRDAPVHTEVPQKISAVGGMPSLKAIVVEDDPRNLKMICQSLGLKNIEAMPFAGAIEVLNFLKIPPKEVFDFMLFDINMPDMDGYTLSNRVFNMVEWKNIPLFALSGRVDENVFVKKKHSFMHLFQKPLDMSYFAQTIKKYV